MSYLSKRTLDKSSEDVEELLREIVSELKIIIIHLSSMTDDENESEEE